LVCRAIFSVSYFGGQKKGRWGYERFDHMYMTGYGGSKLFKKMWSVVCLLELLDGCDDHIIIYAFCIEPWVFG
jgi:hypothetical protein